MTNDHYKMDRRIVLMTFALFFGFKNQQSSYKLKIKFTYVFFDAVSERKERELKVQNIAHVFVSTFGSWLD